MNKSSSVISRPVSANSSFDLFQRIGEICAVVTSVSTSKELLEVSLRKTMGLFTAQRGSIFILDKNGKDLILKIAHGMKISEERQMVKRLGQGVVGKVAAGKKPIIVADIAKDERFRNYRARASYKTPSFICAPLLFKDQILGVINLSDKICGSQFLEEELQILDFLATQIALNYRRLELYDDFKEAVREREALKDELGKSSQEASILKKQIVIQEKFATIGKMAGGIAHEFNNPLDGVIRYTNLCLEHTRDDDIVHGYLIEIKQGLHRMANIVKSLLACSRNAAGATRRMINPNQAVDQAVHAMKTHLMQKQVTVKKMLSKDIPEIMDYGLEQVVSNLLRNALDAVSESGEIRIKTACEGANILLEVEDNGCGVKEADIEKIFEPFYTTKDIDKGCGLGLTVVTEIVKGYQGQIRVASHPGRGTTFSIIVPAQDRR